MTAAADLDFDTYLSSLQARRERGFAIMRAGNAMGLGLLGFALAVRFDLAEDHAVNLLQAAPTDLVGVEAVSAWVAQIPRQSEPETVQ